MNEQHRNSRKRVMISVIVPVYNKEKYITECLDSLLNQPVDSALFEIICIDDGSVYPAPKTAAARGLNRALAARGTAPPPLI